MTRRNFLKGGTRSRPELDRLNPEWPTRKVAKLYRKYLKKQPPFYHPPISDKVLPPLAVTASMRPVRDVDWNQSPLYTFLVEPCSALPIQILIILEMILFPIP
ncbi:MAG: hypothetical protein Ct9H300mP9_4000 [Candidatus Neomarinimicrobiota bacterium]|nr:MAG: hypothetical protein Ct9H300mP9_4000 [Candidatus Neomarinimicrobiota bacterium]